MYHIATERNSQFFELDIIIGRLTAILAGERIIIYCEYFFFI